MLKESIKIPLDYKWNFLHNSVLLHSNIINITSRKFLHFITQWSIFIPSFDNYLPFVTLSLSLLSHFSYWLRGNECRTMLNGKTMVFCDIKEIFFILLAHNITSMMKGILGKEFSNKYWALSEFMRERERK